MTSRDEYPLPSSAALPPTFWWQASLASQGTTRPSPPAQEPHPPPLPCSQFGNGGVLSIGLPTLVFQRFCFGFKISRTLKDPPLTILLFSSDLWRVSRQNGHCHWFPPPWRATGGTIPRKTSTASASPLITCHTRTLLYHQQQRVLLRGRFVASFTRLTFVAPRERGAASLTLWLLPLQHSGARTLSLHQIRSTCFSSTTGNRVPFTTNGL